MSQNTEQYGPTQPEEPKAKKPIYKRWWAIALAAIFVLSGISQATGGGSDTDNASADTKAAASTPDKKDAAAEKAKAEKAAAEKAKAEKAAAKKAAAEKAAAEKAKAEKAAAEKAKAMPVKASQMVKEFEDNELAADAKYKGKTLKITGVVDKIDTEFLDDDKYVLRLGDGSDYVVWTVNCNDMSTKELSTLNKGDSVTVIGEFDDGGDLGVEVKDCKLA